MITELYSRADIRAARSLLERSDLTLEEGYDEMVGIYEMDELVSVGARAGNILKMFAVEPSYQGGTLLADMVTELVGRGLSAGFESLFVYTKPEYITTFEGYNFTLLACQEKVALLEYGKGLERWLSSHGSLIRSGVNGAIVMNCNPFTRGHRYVIEQAAGQVDNLYIFVVTAERSLFPFPVRMQLVREGVADLPNVQVLDTSHYAVSDATFPTYFLKKDDPVARIQMELDLILFSSRIAPFFRITRRFAGSEPCCGLTNQYNETMKRILPLHGITLTEIERKHSSSNGVISASRVREAMAANNLSLLEEMLPETTMAFLRGSEADSIREKLQRDTGAPC
jgi:[citrate (pro-3S)-lyase] ligase